MSNKHSCATEPDRPRIYQIHLEGQLGHQWTEWFDGLTITQTADHNTVLTGPVTDQAALHGLLRKVRDVNLPLISIIRIQ